MIDVDNADAAELIAANQKKKRFLFAIFGNVVLLVVMVGGPFLRGYFRTRALWREFDKFAACLHGATPSEELGMGLPNGSEPYFAARVLAPGKDWPGSCQKILEAATPDEPTFILPSLKVAEGDIRAAAKLVHQELSALSVRTPGERIATRPLRALEHLRSAITRHSQTAGVLEVPDGDAFKLPKSVLPVPVRLPLFASSDARIDVSGDDQQLTTVAVDLTGISYLHLAGGAIEQKRLPRPKLLEAFLPSGDGALFVWAMPRARCREREGGCALKAMGVAPATLPVVEPPRPRWLGAHPAGRVDRSVLRRGDQLLVLAETKEPARELRTIALPEPAVDDAASELPPVPASTRWAATAPGDGVLLELAGAPRALFAQRTEQSTQLVMTSSEAPTPVALGQLSAASDAWLVTTPCRDGVALAFGHEKGLVLGHLAGDGTLHAWPELALSVHNVVDDRDPAHDRVRAMCVSEQRAQAFARDDSDTLLMINCDRASNACTKQPLASNVFSFVALQHADEQLLAFAGAKEHAQIRLLAVDEQGNTRVSERVPAACWAPWGGMCGTALLAQTGSRIVLGAREGTDLMMLESADGGRTWLPLHGIKR